MAVTTGTTSSSGNNNNVNTSYSWQHITNADTDCLVVVVAGYDGTEGDADVTQGHGLEACGDSSVDEGAVGRDDGPHAQAHGLVQKIHEVGTHERLAAG